MLFVCWLHQITVSLRDSDQSNDGDVDKQTNEGHWHDEKRDEVVVVCQDSCAAGGLSGSPDLLWRAQDPSIDAEDVLAATGARIVAA